VLKILSLVPMFMMLQPLCCVVVDVDGAPAYALVFLMKVMMPQPLCCVDDAPTSVLC
jgi:hypothetical protein